MNSSDYREMERLGNTFLIVIFVLILMAMIAIAAKTAYEQKTDTRSTKVSFLQGRTGR